MLRRDQSSVPGADFRSPMPRQPETYDLTTETVRKEHNKPKTPTTTNHRPSYIHISHQYSSSCFHTNLLFLILFFNVVQTTIEGQPGGASAPGRFLQLRPSLSVRSPHPPPQIGIRLPNRVQPPLTSQATGGAVIRLQNPGGQGPTRRDGNPSPQQTVQEAGGRGGGGGGGSGLQDQIQALGSEVHSLGLSIRMLVEQQCRLEREQVQQTQVQRQILSTLKSLASRLGSCSSLQQQHNKTPSPPSLPNASASTSFSQDTFTYSQGTYAQCSQAQPNYNSVNSLESVEAFKLPGLSQTSMNGFQPCSNAESLPLTHTPTHTQPYATAYTQQHSQTLMPSYTQSFAPTYTQSHSQPYRGTESKAPDYPSSCSAGALQDCSVSAQSSPEDPQLNIIKVEGP